MSLLCKKNPKKNKTKLGSGNHDNHANISKFNDITDIIIAAGSNCNKIGLCFSQWAEERGIILKWLAYSGADLVCNNGNWWNINNGNHNYNMKKNKAANDEDKNYH